MEITFTTNMFVTNITIDACLFNWAKRVWYSSGYDCSHVDHNLLSSKNT